MLTNIHLNYLRLTGLSVWLFLLAVSHPGYVFAQQLPFRVYSVKEGLPQSQISGIVQDKSGYLWLATAEGLTSFNGYRFIHFNKKDGLAGSLINKIFIDSRGTIWLGHRASGLTRYQANAKRFEVVDLPDEIGKAEIKDIAETADSTLFIATVEHGLIVYRKNRWQLYERAKDQLLGKLGTLCSDGNRIWLGGDNGLFLYDPAQEAENRIIPVELTQNHSMLSVTGLILDHEKNLWVCTAGEGTYILTIDRQSENPQARPTVKLRADFPPFTAQCSYVDRSGKLWFGSKELGIICYDPPGRGEKANGVTLINNDNGLFREDITAIYEDREGSFWFGTNGGGVYQYRGRSLEQFGKHEGLPDEVIWAVHEDKQGRFWFGSASGLTCVANIEEKIENWQIKRYISPRRYANSSIIDIAAGSNEELWVAIHRTGVRIFNPVSGHYRKVPGLDEEKIICIEKGNDQDLWFGTFYNGVYRYEQKTGKITNYRDTDGLGSNTVFDILRTKNGDIWFATNQTGLTRYNGSSFDIYDRSQGLSASSLLTLAEDSKGRLWIGSEGEGLYLYDGKNFLNYSRKYGIWNEDIYSIICDDYDDVFIGTRRGIEKIDPQSGRSKKYGDFYGFSAIETNQNAVYKDTRGRLWFGTINGVLRYNPREDRKNTVQPITTINSIRINQQEIPFSDEARYSYNDNQFTFHFSGLSFVAPEKIRYSYMLEGLDPEWSPITEDRNATYANLNPGSYVFRVKSANSDGVWNENAASYAFSITSPFWQSYWLYFILIAVIGASVYGTHHLRVRKISHNNLVLEEMVRTRTADLITEKEKAQKAYDALRESEEKLIQVTSSIDAYLWSLSFAEDQTLTGTFITDTFFHMTGIDKPEISAETKWENFLQYVHADDQNLVREAFKSALQGTTVNVSFRLINSEGNECWHYNHAFPVKNKEGKVSLIHGVGFDVTNRKLAEQALRKSEEKYATFMRFSTEAIWCIDLKEPVDTTKPLNEQVDLIMKNAFLSDSNDAMANLYGYDAAKEIIGLPLSTGLLKENEANQKLLKHFIQDGYRLKNAEFAEIDRNGKSRMMLVGFVGILEDNRLVRCWGTQRDITLQKEAEQVLRDSEEMYRRLIERSPDAIIVHSGGIIDYINKSGVAMYGGECADQFIGRRLIDFSHPQFRELGRQRIEQIYTQKKEVSLMEQKMIRLDGTEFDVEVAGAPIIYKGKASGQSIVRDITEKKKMEAELQKAQKLESVGLLAGGIAHDFNNILTAILGNISMGKLYSPSGSEALTMLTQAEKATLQAKDLTQQLLTFSKGGAPVKETASIFEMVKESANFVLRGSNIDAVYECAEGLWTAEIDTAQMSQVIQNLIINAEQAMPDGKKITIKLKNVYLKDGSQPGLKAGKYVQISIIDQGIGIPEEHLHKVFDPYFTTKQKGSGLGLATSYSIIRKHEGHINLHSSIGMGTKVTIYLPASEKVVPAGAQRTETLKNGKGKILVMDDEEMLRQLTAQFLSHLGYQVRTVPDGEQAIQAYREEQTAGEPFSLVIMDLTIPGRMGGKETIEELKKIDPDVNAIVSSGYSNDPVLSNYKSYGFSAVLPKPYKIETLSAVISDTLKA